MGTLTREELREEVNKSLGDQLEGLSGSELTSAQDRLNRALELTQTRIARTHDFSELYYEDIDPVTVTGTLSTDLRYSGLPSNLRTLYALIWTDPANQRTDNRYLVHVPSRQWAQFLGQDQNLATGDITHYSLWGAVIEWYKIPSANFELIRRYAIWPSTFASDGDTSDLDEKDDVLVAGALEYMFRSLGQEAEARQWYVVYTDRLGQAIIEDRKRPSVSFIPRGLGDSREPLGDYWLDWTCRRAP
jgi:hypothetical protein